MIESSEESAAQAELFISMQEQNGFMEVELGYARKSHSHTVTKL